MSTTQDKDATPSISSHTNNTPGEGSGRRKRDIDGQPKPHYHGRNKKHHSQGHSGGNDKDKPAAQRGNVAVRSTPYSAMFEGFRDELDEHHDRRERVIKVSRDVTALSKKMIFTLLRTPSLSPDTPLPPSIESDFRAKLRTITSLISSIVPDISTGPNRDRYQVRGLEEFVEAVSLYYYLRHQKLISPEESAAFLLEGLALQEAKEAGKKSEEADGAKEDAEEVKLPKFEVTIEEYLGGVLDLFGEMMRFATNMAGLSGTLAPTNSSAPASGAVVCATTSEGHGDAMDIDQPAATTQDSEEEKKAAEGRTILSDMQEFASCFELLRFGRPSKDVKNKMEGMRASVQKVERLGYGLVVRGSERPKGWTGNYDGGGEERGIEA